MARRKKRRKLAGAALAAHRKKVGKRKARTTRRAGSRVAKRGGGSMARKRKHSRRRASRKRRSPVTTLRRHAVYATNRKRRRHSYRRNPGGLFGTVMKDATQGVKDAAGILVGKAATRVVSNLIPIGTNAGIVGAVKQVVVAVGVGIAAKKLVKRGEFARFVTAGGIAGALETIVKGLNIPVLSANLGGGEELISIDVPTGPGISAYPGGPTIGAYPMGDLGDGMGELGMMATM